MSTFLTVASSPRVVAEQRASERQALAVAGRIVWKDARGVTRFNSVVIRDLSDTGAYVENVSGVPIPLYHLVSLQVERVRAAGPLPALLEHGKLPSAVFRLGPTGASTGTPAGYGLRLLVEPRRKAARTLRPAPVPQLMVAQPAMA